MSTETENNLMDKRKESLDKNWKSSIIKHNTQLVAENQIEFIKEIGVSINFSNISDDDIDCSRCKDGYILMVGKFLGSSDIR